MEGNYQYVQAIKIAPTGYLLLPLTLPMPRTFSDYKRDCHHPAPNQGSPVLKACAAGTRGEHALDGSATHTTLLTHTSPSPAPTTQRPQTLVTTKQARITHFITLRQRLELLPDPQRGEARSEAKVCIQIIAQHSKGASSLPPLPGATH